jgi:hypothetical protein
MTDAGTRERMKLATQDDGAGARCRNEGRYVR